MAWKEIRLVIEASQADLFSEKLESLGAVSITFMDPEDSPIYEPELNTNPLWEKSLLIGLFEDNLDFENNYQKFCLWLMGLENGTDLLRSLKIKLIKNQDWERAWMADFKPIQCADNLWICPSWHTPPDPQAITIQLDPGLAFGTGTHPTTQLCLAWLAKQDLKDRVVIDYGCGSGILAVAAMLCGAREVWAVDIDPQAIEASVENAKRNSIDLERFHCGLVGEMDLPQGDYLLANILAGLLCDLNPKINALLIPHGQFVLSGILPEQADLVAKSYEKWAKIQKINEKNGWIAILGQKNGI